MSTYTPDRWVMIEISSPDTDPTRKILAGWYGGFAQGDSWKINSGITETREFEDRFEFDGYSGSTYVCYKQSEGLSNYMLSVLSSFQEQGKDKGVVIEVIPLSS